MEEAAAVAFSRNWAQTASNTGAFIVEKCKVVSVPAAGKTHLFCTGSAVTMATRFDRWSNKNALRNNTRFSNTPAASTGTGVRSLTLPDAAGVADGGEAADTGGGGMDSNSTQEAEVSRTTTKSDGSSSPAVSIVN